MTSTFKASPSPLLRSKISNFPSSGHCNSIWFSSRQTSSLPPLLHFRIASNPSLERRVKALFAGLKGPERRLIRSTTPTSAWQAQRCGSEMPSEQEMLLASPSVPSGNAGSFGPGACDMTCDAVTAVAKPVVEARPPPAFSLMLATSF